jgi:AcrR family transcriptional regulator
MPNPGALSPLKAARRDKILDAAEGLFVRRGIRATTTEAVAQAAGMSKVTVYGYFKDKDEMFKAVAARFATRIEDAVLAAFASEGTPARRIAAGLAAKHELVFEVVRASAFAAELFAAKDRVVSALFLSLDRDIEREIAALLVASGNGKSKAAATARILFGAASGVAERANSRAEMRRDIETVVAALV